MRHLFLPLSAVVLAVTSPATVLGQETGSPLVPRGAMRLEVRPLFSAFDTRFTSSVGLPRDLGDEFTVPGVGPRLVPALEFFEAAVESAAGTSFSARIGALSAVLQKSQTRVPLGVDVGVFDWLSIGATVPFVRDEAEMAAGFVAFAEANTGFSPGVGTPEVVEGFLGTFGDALTALTAARSEFCDADPLGQPCTDATALSSDASTFFAAMDGLYQTSYLTPLGTSPAGAAILTRWQGFQESFNALGVSGLPSVVPLAQEAMDAASFDRFLSDPRFGTALTAPLRRWENLWRLGDVELRADARILRKEWHGSEDPRGESPGLESPGLESPNLESPGREDPDRENSGRQHLRQTRRAPTAHVEVGGGLTVRLGTGSEDDPANILDQAAGDGQTDLEFRAWASGGWGQRFGAWSQVSFTRPLAGATIRRVFPPASALAPRNTQLPLSWTQGPAVAVSVAPVLKISPELSAVASYTYLRKGEDHFELSQALNPNEGETLPDPSILEAGSDVQVQTLSLGLVYRTVGNERGAAPIEIRALYHRALSGAGGNVPRVRSIEAGFRIFKGLWGQ